MVSYCLYVDTLLYFKLQTFLDEVFTFIGNESLLRDWKVDSASLEHDSLMEDAHLAHLVSEGLLAVEHFVVDHPDGPDVYLWSDDCFFISLEAFWREVPISANTLRSQFNYVFLCGLAEAEISDLDASFVEHDVLGLQIVVDDLIGQFMKILYGVDYLPQDHFGFLFRDFLVFFEVMRQIGSLTVLQDGAEGVRVDLHGVVQAHDIGMLQHSMNIVFSHGVPHVIFLCIRLPAGMELVYLTGHFLQILNVECFIHLTEPTLPQEPQQLVFLYFLPSIPFRPTLQPSVFAVLLFEQHLTLLYVECFLLFKTTQQLLQMGFLSGEEVALGSQGVLPFFWILVILLHMLPSTFLAFFKCFLFFDYCFNFFPNFPYFSPIYPRLPSFSVRIVLPNAYLICVYPQSQLVPMSLMSLYCHLYDILLQSCRYFISLPHSLAQESVFLSQGLYLTFVFVLR